MNEEEPFGVIIIITHLLGGEGVSFFVVVGAKPETYLCHWI